MSKDYRHIQTQEEHRKLIESGMFWEFHPELSGNWQDDEKVIKNINYDTVLAVFFRPKTRSELLNKLKEGIKCEVVASNEQVTSILLDGWLEFKGKYKTYPSENIGWVIYEAV